MQYSGSRAHNAWSFLIRLHRSTTHTHFRTSSSSGELLNPVPLFVSLFHFLLLPSHLFSPSPFLSAMRAASSPSVTPLLFAVHCFVYLSFLCHCLVSGQFNLSLFNGNLPFEVRVDSVIAVTRAPMAYTNSMAAIAVAPTGSWLLYGTQEDVWLSSNNGGTWSLLAGQSGNSLPGLDNVTWAATGSGNSGCSHRTTFNRFYWMGTSNQNSAAVGTTGTFFNYVSTDGQEWIQILDAASSTGMSKRLGNEFGICVVDQYERVYSILGGDTWVSNNLGVTFTPVQATNYFPLRQDHSGVIYTPSGSVESIVIIAGRIWSVATAYGADQVREQSTQQQQHTHALGHRRSAATAALPSRRLTALT